MYWFKKKTDAYFTVEASFLVPIVFFVFALVIHLLFFTYGRSIIVQDAYVTALRASLLREGEDRAAFVAQNANTQFGGKYFGNDVPSMTGVAEGRYIRTEAKTQSHRSGYDLGRAGRWSYDVRAKAIDLNVPARIRRIARIADMIESGIKKAKQGE